MNSQWMILLNFDSNQFHHRRDICRHIKINWYKLWDKERSGAKTTQNRRMSSMTKISFSSYLLISHKKNTWLDTFFFHQDIAIQCRRKKNLSFVAVSLSEELSSWGESSCLGVCRSPRLCEFLCVYEYVEGHRQAAKSPYISTCAQSREK